jgi:hypothetical protein
MTIQTILCGSLGALSFGTFNYYISMKAMELHNKYLEQIRNDFSKKNVNITKI